MSINTIDFEIRSRVDIKDVGAYNLANHESTEILCMAYKLAGSDVTKIWRPFENDVCRLVEEVIEGETVTRFEKLFDGDPVDLFEAIDRGELIEAHNSFFERCVWHLICVAKLGWPSVPFKNWRCSMAKAAAAGMPRGLGALAMALGLDVEKSKEGRKVMLQMCKPRKPSKNNPSEWFDDAERFAKLYAYCVLDVDVEHAASEALPEMSDYELKLWQLDQVINMRGLPVDVESAKAAIEICKKAAEENNHELADITAGAVEAATEVNAIKDFINSQGVEMENVRAETVSKMLLTPKAFPPVVNRVLKLRQQGSKTSTAKFAALVNLADDKNRLRDTLGYHGAHTGRWAGYGFQNHNLPRAGVKNPEMLIDAINLQCPDMLRFLYGDPIDTCKKAIRSTIKAEDGMRLIVCDFASIEARVEAWAVGQETMLEIFKSGKCIYLDMASRVYGETITDKKDERRQVGKVAILALGYGMGAKTFLGRLQLIDETYTEDFAQDIVDLYRESYPEIPAFWKSTGRAAIAAVENPGIVYRSRCVAYKYDGTYLYCRLPSGRKLHYRDPRIVEVNSRWGLRPCLTYAGVDSKYGWTRIRTYGARLVENIIQAIARDLLADAMFRCEAAGYPLITHVHDEVVSERPYGEGSIEEVEKLLCVVPDWAEGCPIAAEGFESERYKK